MQTNWGTDHGMTEVNMFIDGKWVEAASGERFPVLNPATMEEVATVPSGGREEALQAIRSAHRAFHDWKQTTAYERADYMMRWHELIMQHRDALALTMTKEQGKPLAEAAGEIAYAASFIMWYAEEAKRIYGETIPAGHRNKRILVTKQPVGVVAAITPRNFPAAMITRKVGPALAAGCTCVVKPAEDTPLTALYLAKLAEEAGFPPGVLNVITGDPQEIGETLLEDARVTKVTFTGSTEVGKIIMRGAADTVKKVSLELGGHAPVIVTEDANVDHAVEQTFLSKFRNAGQTCICANRIYVHRSIRDEFVQKLSKLVQSKLKVGYGEDEGVSVGPVINEEGLKKIEHHVEDAISKGAKVVTGGQKTNLDGYSGHFYEPTVISYITSEMILMQEETFGPVAPVMEFTEDEEAIRLANDSRYGLAAYLFTSNLSKALKLAEQLEYGIVGVNDGAPSTAQAPFGGIKESGVGREGGRQGIEEYLEMKYVSIGLD